MYLWKLYRLTSSEQNWVPLSELATLSRGGDQRVMPQTWGMTSMMQPLAEDMAGRPFCKIEVDQEMSLIRHFFHI